MLKLNLHSSLFGHDQNRQTDEYLAVPSVKKDFNGVQMMGNSDFLILLIESQG
jgi:hypothetical protein